MNRTWIPSSPAAPNWPESSGEDAPERVKVAHLLRRAGFGASREDLDFFTDLGVDGAVRYLVDYESVPDDADRLAHEHELDLTQKWDMKRWWMLRMIHTRRPLVEKIALFWHGHFVSEIDKVGEGLMLRQHAFFRHHAVDAYGKILAGINRDPAMMVYLDNVANQRDRPNENYVRELWERFTLGVEAPDGTPNYTEHDVREAARAFTGWSITSHSATGAFKFVPQWHDASPKTIFGRTGKFTGDDIVELTMAHPAWAPFICRKLFEFFVYQNPEPEVVAPLVDVFRTTGGSIREVLRSIFTSSVFFSERAYRAQVKSPVELVVHISRALPHRSDGWVFWWFVPQMGQRLFQPPNVGGWPNGAGWLTTSTWLHRVNYANLILGHRDPEHQNIGPVDLYHFAREYELVTAEQAVDFFLDLLIDGRVDPPRRQVLLDYVRASSAPPQAQQLTPEHPWIDRTVRGLIYLIVAMPEFQLA